MGCKMSDIPESTPKKSPARAGGKKQAEAAGADTGAAQTLPFETALEKLEAIVESLESGDVPLADLLSRYEEASGLLKTCQQQLDAAQLRIERLARKDGQDALEPFTPEA